MVRALILILCLLASACKERAAPDALGPDALGSAAGLIARDPVMARALHDPLMTDPDLASRNEANAAIGFADSGALPVFAASSEDAAAVRTAMRLELREGGAIPDLPPAREDPRGQRLGPMAEPADLIAAVGAPEACGAQLRDNFALAASLPPVAAIPPRAMVLQAGGADTGACRIRIIRYSTAAAPEDALQYHHTRALRAGLSPARHAAPEDLIAATGPKGETLVVHVRPALRGLTGVDLIYRAP